MLFWIKLSKITTCAAFFALGLIIRTPVANGATPYLGNQPYKSFNDSPFQGLSYSYFHLEDFEDGSLTTPGVTASAGKVVSPNTLTDSVDGDDGSIDGSGSGGHSWYSQGSSILKFSFNSSVLGTLPTNVGIVWTDVGFSNVGFGYGKVNYEAFDAVGTSLGIFGVNSVGDGDVSGKTAEDKFFGATYAGGISAIQISMPDSTDWEVDHLQYGRAKPVPEPTTFLTSLFAVVMGVALRGKSRRKLADKIKSSICYSSK